ncbi:MAG: hypothetical protein ACRDIA_04050 [Actinomycetota bacterium]
MAAGLNGAIMLAYFLISFVIFRALSGSHSVRSNRLASASGLVFASCGAVHGYHMFYMLLPAFGSQFSGGLALRAAYDWRLLAIDAVTGVVAVWYWSLRHQYGPLLEGKTAAAADISALHRRAVELNDSIVQGLAFAKYALDDGDEKSASVAVAKTLRSARRMIAEILAESGAGDTLEAGNLRRSRAQDLSTSKIARLG